MKELLAEKKFIFPQVIHCGEVNRKADIGTHHHPGNEIIYVKRGHCMNFVDNAEIEAQNGDVLCVPAGTSHSQKNIFLTWTLFVAFQNGSEQLNKSPLLIKTRDDAWVCKWFSDICAIHENLLPNEQDLANGILYSLLHRLETLVKANWKNMRKHICVAYRNVLNTLWGFFKRNQSNMQAD